MGIGTPLLSCLAVPFGCLAVPFGGFLIILFYSLTIFIHKTKVILGIGTPLLSCLAVPFGGFLIILFYSLTQKKHFTNEILGFSIPLFSTLDDILDDISDFFFTHLSKSLLSQEGRNKSYYKKYCHYSQYKFHGYPLVG